MKLKANEAVTETFGHETSSQEFRIKSTGKTFEVLSSKLYKDKITAIVRELSCNAYDSHIAAGCPDRPFEVQLPGALDPNFVIRDFGTGLDHENVMNVFSMFFASTKEDSNDFIGAFGLGSKSPFALVDLFTVTAYCGRERRSYACFKDRGIPHVSLKSTIASNEECGIEITVPVKQEDHYRFRQAAETVFRWFKVKPLIKGADIQPYERPVFKDRWVYDDRRSQSLTALMGNVAYPISTRLIDLNNNELTNIIIEFDVGELDVQAGREELSYDSQTVDVVKKRVNSIIEKIDNQYQEILKDCSNIFEAQITLDNRANDPEWKALTQVRPPSYQGTPLNYRSCVTFLSKYGHSKLISRFTSLSDRYKRIDEVQDSNKVENFVIFAMTKNNNRDQSRLLLWMKQNPTMHGYTIRPYNPASFAQEMTLAGITVVNSDTISIPVAKAKVRSVSRVKPRECEEIEIELSEKTPMYYIITRNLEWDDPRDGFDIIRDPSFLFNLKSSLDKTMGGLVYFPVSRTRDIPKNWINFHDALAAKFKELNKDKEFRRSLRMAYRYADFLSLNQSWVENVRNLKIPEFDQFFKNLEKHALEYKNHYGWLKYARYYQTLPVSKSKTLVDLWISLKKKYPLVFEVVRPKDAHDDYQRNIVINELREYVAFKDSGDNS